MCKERQQRTKVRSAAIVHIGLTIKEMTTQHCGHFGKYLRKDRRCRCSAYLRWMGGLCLHYSTIGELKITRSRIYIECMSLDHCFQKGAVKEII